MELRKIIHIDMDAFYASVEQRDNPELRGKPVAVGHADARGVVAASSYEARRFGVKSAMSSQKAKRLCPELIFVNGRMSHYKEVSEQIHEIFREYTDIIEPISLDEAFLDVTVNKPGIALGVEIAKEIKAKIKKKLHLIASAGISYNKFLAKIASDYRKPDGLCTIHPSQALNFIAGIPVEYFWGVGPKTARKMHSLGIHTGADLRNWPVDLLIREFGKTGKIYYDFSRGIDNRPVETQHIRKSIGCECTYNHDLSTIEEIDEALTCLTNELLGRLSRKQFLGTTLTLKVKFHDFTQITRSLTKDFNFNTFELIRHFADTLIADVDYAAHPVRLMGLTVSNPHAPHEAAVKRDSGNRRQLLLDFDSTPY